LAWRKSSKRYGEIAARLSELGNQYSNNVLDATMGWSKLVTDVAELAGMPESALAAAQAQAQAKEQEGYLLTLDIPSYLPVMTYCDNQALREELYRAYSTRVRPGAECRQMGQQPGDGGNPRCATSWPSCWALTAMPPNRCRPKWRRTRSRCSTS
jgi:hypothetical protein